MENEEIVWKPFPKQEEALKIVAFEELFGGARGPGKTDTGLAWLLKPFSDDKLNPRILSRYRALVIRKNSNDLTDWLDRASWMYSRYGAQKGSEFNTPAIKFPNGVKFRTGHLKDSQAYTKYIGHEYQRQLIEELNQIENESDYLKLISSCRSTLTGIDPRVFATTNPGGLGHAWIKERFVDVAPWGKKYNYSETINSRVITRSRIFIHSTMDDNPLLMEKDPGYVLSIEQLKKIDPETYRAWRFGDWDVFAGMFFREFRRDLHVIKPFIPNLRNVIIGGSDWGYTAPFSLHLAEIKKVEYNGSHFYRARTFFEIYGTTKKPEEWADEIKEKLKVFNMTLDDITSIQADPAMFNKGTDGSISIKDQFTDADERFRIFKPGSHDRIPGWVNMHTWLSLAPDGLPYWQITDNCINLIKEMGAAVYDENNIEDLDAQYDHALDEQRYMLKSLKWIKGITGQINPHEETPQGNAAKFYGSNENMDQHLLNLDKFI